MKRLSHLTFGFLALFLLAFVATAAPARAAGGMEVIRDQEIEQDLRTFCRPIFDQAGVSPEAVRFILISQNELNAFVAGGQNIFIFTGLILATDNPAELVGVVAHETGHIAHGDLFRMKEEIRNVSLETLLMSVLGIAAAAGASSGDAGAAVLSGASTYGLRDILRHSRAAESAADQAGVRFLEESHLPVSGFLSFMEKLKDQELLPESQQSQYVQTHPLTQDRINFLENMVAQSGAQNYQTPAAWTDMHARMKAKLLGYLFPDRMLQDKGTSIASQYGRVIATYRQGRADAALNMLDPLLKAEPKNPYFYELRGQILFEHARVDDAVAAYAKAVSYAPSAGLIRSAYGHALLESKTDTTARTAEAVRQFETALQTETRDPSIHRFLAIAYGKQGNEGASRLHMAEEALMQNKLEFAVRNAKLAKAALSKNSAGWQRADDILDTAFKARKDQKKDGRGGGDDDTP
ncbi:MAG: M48 family metalloprotease [Micavibrio sp.]|nr:M48 family metalloprotease [Micavibrio sp.]